MNTQTMKPKPSGNNSVRLSARKLLVFATATALTLLAGAVASHATSDAWDGSVNGVWATSGNWLTDPVTVPGTGEIATFNGVGNGNTTIDLGGGVTISNVLFDTASVGPYIIGAGAVGSQTLTLDVNGGVTMSSTVVNSQVLNANIALPTTGVYNFVNNSAASTLTLAGTNTTTSTGIKVIKVDGTGSTSINGPMVAGTGTLNLEKTNSGTLTLSGGANWSGNGVNAILPNPALLPVLLRAGTTIITGGDYTNAGEFALGGVITHGGAGNNAKFTMTGGRLVVTGSGTGGNWFSIGKGNGVGSVSSDVVLSNSASIITANSSLGWNANNGANLPKGSLTLNGNASYAGNGNFYVGESVGSDVTLTVNGSAVVTNLNAAGIRVSSSGKGTMVINGGTVVTEGDLILNFSTSGATNGSRVVLNGGNLHVAGSTPTSTAERWLIVKRTGNANTELVISNGTLHLNNQTDLRFSTQDANATGSNTVTIVNGAITGYSDRATTVGGNVQIDMQRNGGAATVNTFNLDGGVVTVRDIISGVSSGTRIFNFNGGTLRPNASTTTFFNLGAGSAFANVRNGGAIIDSNGRDITIVQNLQHSDVSGDNATDGGLTKQGAGTLTLPATSTFNGPLTVSGGTLALDASSGSSLNVASLSLANNTALRFNYSGNPSVAAINAAGAVTAGANITIHFTGSGFTAGQFPVIDYSGAALPNLNNFSLGTLPVGVLSATLVNNTANSSIDINITAIGQSLTWLGTNNLWDINTTFNWNNSSFQPAKYLEYIGVGDLVRFDDTLDVNTLNTNVNLTTTLSPATVVVDNATYPYTFTGVGSIAGSASLVKSNLGSLTLTTANSYSGGTHIYGGTVNANTDAQLGTAAGGVTLGGGNLEFAASTTSARPVTMAAVSSLTAGSGATVQLNNTFSGTQRLNLDGPGTKVMNNSNRLWFHARGGTTILEGNARYTNDINWTSIAPYYDSLVSSADARLILRGNAYFDAGNFDFNVSDSTLANAGDSGRLDIQDNATLYFRNLWVGKGLNATGLVYQTGGTFTNFYTASADLRIGGNAVDQLDTFGGFYLSGGRTDLRRLLQIGAFGIGEMVVSGSGQFSNSASVVVGRFGGSQGTLTVSSGSFNVGSDLIVGENGTGTMTVSGTGVARATAPLSIGGFGAPGTGTVSVVTGGRLIVPQVRMMPVAGLSTFNFNGGTLEANASSSAFINNLTAANILAGGAIIDSSSNNITVSSALLDGGGNGGLTKLGTGALTLLGTNNYSGATIVTAGSLVITPNHKTPSSTVTVAGGTSFGAFANTNGTAIVGNLTLGSVATDLTTLTFTFNANPSSPILQAVAITVNGTNAFRLSGTIVAGVIPLVKYTSLGGAGVLLPNITGPQGMTATLSNNVANTTLYAIVTGAPGIVWRGTNSNPVLANVWADGVTNWLAAGNPAAYLEPTPPGDPVTFNDIGSGTVLLSNTVAPASLTLSNQTQSYTFSGTGKISGTVGLTKQGAGTATMSLAGNDYTGNTTVSAGTLQLGSTTAIPEGPTAGGVVVGSTGTLDVNGFSETINGLSGSGIINNASGTGATLTIGNGNGGGTWSGLTTNTGGGTVTFIKTGTGSLTLAGTNYLGGTSQFNGGTNYLTGRIEAVGAGEFWVQQNGGNSTFIVNGGGLTVNNWFVVGRNAADANGTFILNSGTVNKTGGGNIVIGSLNATGLLEINGGQLLNNSMLWLGENASANATLRLNGGLIQATQVRPNNAVAASFAYFNGGTLQASASSADFIATATSALIQSGGLILDTQAFGLTNASPLVEDGASPGGGLTKIGTGTLALTGANSYSGLTTVSNGTLSVDGSISGAVTVKSGATLGGIGYIGGVVTVETGGKLGAGASIGNLTLGASPVLGGSVVAELDRNDGVTTLADLITVSGPSVNYGGTLVLSNAGAALQVGDTFKVFEASSYSGSFTLVSQTPLQTVTWNTANLTANGTISVATAVSGPSTTPTNIAFSVTGNALNLSWPVSHLGWTLQTNAVSVAAPASWFAYPGSTAVTSVGITINPSLTNVFFRLVLP
jgi:fibronectin-binding autotransporter adhesin